jgi:hypothetical protein
VPLASNTPGGSGSGSAVVDPLAVAAGYLGWSYNPILNNANASAVSGRPYGTALWLPFGTVVTNVILSLNVLAVGAAPTGIFYGLCTPTGKMVAQSNNLVGSFPVAAGPYASALTATYTTTSSDSSTGMYYGLILVNGTWATTQATFGRTNPGTSSVTGFGAFPGMSMNGTTGGQTNLPANGATLAGGVTPNNAQEYFVAVS